MTTAMAERLTQLGTSMQVPEPPPLSAELIGAFDVALPAGEVLTIKEAAELTGVSAHTLRYYERAGLVEVARDSSGCRAYDRQALARLVFVTRLRLSDMSIRAIAHYLDLVRLGDSTVPERLAFMQAHRHSIRQRLCDLQAALAVVEYKIETYGGHCQP
ncbi:MAG: MerR family transcriptional regulator [Acidimicrobiales bacterium]